MKMITFICNKLARDNTIETMYESGIITKHQQLTKPKLKKALQQKLLEEATEVAQSANRSDIIAELADVCEVIDGLKKAYTISSNEIEIAQLAKRKRRGGFEKGVFLESITLAEENPWTKSFRTAPEKYIETTTIKHDQK